MRTRIIPEPDTNVFNIQPIWETSDRVKVTLIQTDVDDDVDEREFIWGPHEDMPVRQALNLLVEEINELPHWRASYSLNQVSIGPANPNNQAVVNIARY